MSNKPDWYVHTSYPFVRNITSKDNLLETWKNEFNIHIYEEELIDFYNDTYSFTLRFKSDRLLQFTQDCIMIYAVYKTSNINKYRIDENRADILVTPDNKKIFFDSKELVKDLASFLNKHITTENK